MKDPMSLRAVAEALPIWYELEREPGVEVSDEETHAWWERFGAAVDALRAEAGDDAMALRTAHGDPSEQWSDDLADGLLLIAAKKAEDEAKRAEDEARPLE
jgi:hypothetical protein